MQVGDMNLVNAILMLELQVGVLQKAVDHLNAKAGYGNQITQAQYDQFAAQVKTSLQQKYPNMGIN